MATSKGSTSSSVPGKLIHHTIDQLLLEVRKETQDRESLSDNLLSALHSVFQQPLLHALDLVDKEFVTRYACLSGRELYRVQASSGNKVYTCLVSSNYCSCPSFVYSVVLKEDSLMCKHILAVQLSRAMGKHKTEQVSGEEFAKLLADDKTSCDQDMYT